MNTKRYKMNTKDLNDLQLLNKLGEQLIHLAQDHNLIELSFTGWFPVEGFVMGSVSNVSVVEVTRSMVGNVCPNIVCFQIDNYRVTVGSNTVENIEKNGMDFFKEDNINP
jgi:hypothetical protein